MNNSLEKLLVEKYPKIFQDRYLPPKESCMFWGFEHGDGWFHIIDSLCFDIQKYIDFKKDIVPQVVASQVKEKFGTLRFYYYGGDDVIDGMVSVAEKFSSVICENCGAPGKVRDIGYIKTLCDKHYEVSDDNRISKNS